jgi:hypothetical protein
MFRQDFIAKGLRGLSVLDCVLLCLSKRFCVIDVLIGVGKVVGAKDVHRTDPTQGPCDVWNLNRFCVTMLGLTFYYVSLFEMDWKDSDCLWIFWLYERNKELHEIQERCSQRVITAAATIRA